MEVGLAQPAGDRPNGYFCGLAHRGGPICQELPERTGKGSRLQSEERAGDVSGSKA